MFNIFEFRVGMNRNDFYCVKEGDTYRLRVIKTEKEGVIKFPYLRSDVYTDEYLRMHNKPLPDGSIKRDDYIWSCLLYTSRAMYSIPVHEWERKQRMALSGFQPGMDRLAVRQLAGGSAGSVRGDKAEHQLPAECADGDVQQHVCTSGAVRGNLCIR